MSAVVCLVHIWFLLATYVKDILSRSTKTKSNRENLLCSYVDSTRQLGVNLSGGAGEDLKKMMAEHSLMAKEDTSNAGISQDVTYLKQAAHLLRTGNYKFALKYTINALEFNPNSKVKTRLKIEL